MALHSMLGSGLLENEVQCLSVLSCAPPVSYSQCLQVLCDTVDSSIYPSQTFRIVAIQHWFWFIIWFIIWFIVVHSGEMSYPDQPTTRVCPQNSTKFSQTNDWEWKSTSVEFTGFSGRKSRVQIMETSSKILQSSLLKVFRREFEFSMKDPQITLIRPLKTPVKSNKSQLLIKFSQSPRRHKHNKVMFGFQPIIIPTHTFPFNYFRYLHTCVCIIWGKLIQN